MRRTILYCKHAINFFVVRACSYIIKNADDFNPSVSNKAVKSIVAVIVATEKLNRTNQETAKLCEFLNF